MIDTHASHACVSIHTQAPPYFRIPALRDVMSMGTTLGPLGMMYACKNMCYMLIQVHERLCVACVFCMCHIGILWVFCGYFVGVLCFLVQHAYNTHQQCTMSPHPHPPHLHDTPRVPRLASPQWHSQHTSPCGPSGTCVAFATVPLNRQPWHLCQGPGGPACSGRRLGCWWGVGCWWGWW